MKIKTLIKKLKKFNQDTPIRFYFLENWNLEGCKIETILDVGEQIELTLQKENTMDGGVSRWAK